MSSCPLVQWPAKATLCRIWSPPGDLQREVVGSAEVVKSGRHVVSRVLGGARLAGTAGLPLRVRLSSYRYDRARGGAAPVAEPPKAQNHEQGQARNFEPEDGRCPRARPLRPSPARGRGLPFRRSGPRSWQLREGRSKVARGSTPSKSQATSSRQIRFSGFPKSIDAPDGQTACPGLRPAVRPSRRPSGDGRAGSPARQPAPPPTHLAWRPCGPNPCETGTSRLGASWAAGLPACSGCSVSQPTRGYQWATGQIRNTPLFWPILSRAAGRVRLLR